TAALRRVRAPWPALLAERGELRAGARRRTGRRGDRGRRAARHLPARSLARTGLRRLPAHQHRPGRAYSPLHRGARGGAVRRALIDRRTTETQIAVKLRLDGAGRYRVRTGVRFLDHMLELFARHGAFDLEIAATGDLDVDQHHTVEDVGIALGEAVSQALGD